MPKPITEDNIIALLKPLAINDIVISTISTKPDYLEINYRYNNINFRYLQSDPKFKGNLQASIQACQDKVNAYLTLDYHHILNVSADNNLSVTLIQDSSCFLNNIKNLTEQLEEDLYKTLDDFNLTAY